MHYMQCILHYQEHVEIRWKVSAKWHYKLLELGGGKKNPNTLHWQMAIIPPSQGQTPKRGGGGGGGGTCPEACLIGACTSSS